MTTQLPLFPLTTALVPGLVFPLHIFEPRYRLMVEELLAKPEEEREFGIVAARESFGRSGSPLEGVYPVGVAALIRQAEQLDDGRYDIVTIGSRRFQIVEVDASAPLLRAEVEFLPDPEVDAEDPVTQRLTTRAVDAFDGYRAVLGGRLQEERDAEEVLPSDPTILSYLITAALVVDARTRQELLASPDTLTRLRESIRIMGNETSMISILGAVPALDLLQAGPSAN